MPMLFTITFTYYHVSLAISNIRYRFQNIGSLYDEKLTIYVKNRYQRLTMGLSSEKKKKSEILEDLFFPSFPALCHIHVAIIMSLLIAYNV